MSAIEPNVGALVWFALLWTATCLGFLVLCGMYPMQTRPEAARKRGALPLIVLNSALWLALAAGTLAFGYGELRLTTLIVVGGLVMLFAPAPFEAVPPLWRDGRPGLAALLALQVAGLGIWLAVSQSGASLA
ncbi:hypothetical protein V5F77_20965 [Xanthobacter sp. DSM 24535]|uniref:hypothetical protein n=1 Tax=Roseixanthobacter psychrophilus TaxID=3119917 RepID=UPI00372A7E21